MDLTFRTRKGIFNYRACAVILNNNKLLAMKTDLAPYYFLPGGRVKFNENSEEAIIREIKEELGCTAKIIRPLWFNESFFTEDVTKEKFHELCVYYLVELDNEGILNQATIKSNHKHHEVFEWLDIAALNEKYLYPLFIKDRINSLPLSFELIREYK